MDGGTNHNRYAQTCTLAGRPANITKQKPGRSDLLYWSECSTSWKKWARVGIFKPAEHQRPQNWLKTAEANSCLALSSVTHDWTCLSAVKWQCNIKWWNELAMRWGFHVLLNQFARRVFNVKAADDSNSVNARLTSSTVKAFAIRRSLLFMASASTVATFSVWIATTIVY